MKSVRHVAHPDFQFTTATNRVMWASEFQQQFKGASDLEDLVRKALAKKMAEQIDKQLLQIYA